MNRPWLIAAVAIVLGIAIGLAYSWRAGLIGSAPPPPAPTLTPAPPSAAVAAAASAPAGPTFALAGSEPLLRAAVARLLGPEGVGLLRPGIAAHVVATVDALPRRHFPPDAWPVQGLGVAFIATSDDQKAPLAEDNYPRYARYVALLARLDAHAAAALYWQHYGLLQQAYREAGHAAPEQFNDRLIAAIDSVLAAADAEPPVLVLRPSALYEFADTGLEERPAGQKLLLRAGPRNAAIIRRKLLEVKQAITSLRPATLP